MMWYDKFLIMTSQNIFNNLSHMKYFQHYSLVFFLIIYSFIVRLNEVENKKPYKLY